MTSAFTRRRRRISGLHTWIAWGALAIAPLSATDATVPVGPNFEIAASTAQDAIGGNPPIAFDGTRFFVVWGPSTIEGVRVAADGTVLDGSPLHLGSGSATPSVAFDGTNFLVVWVGGEILAVRVSPDGTILDNPPLQVTTGGNPLARRISLAFDGTRYLIAWRTTGNEILAARVATDGTIVDGPAGFLLGSGFYPWVAFDGSNYLVVWHAWGNSLDILGNRVAATDGTVLDGGGFTISGAAGHQEHASVAFDGTHYLVVWTDERGGDDFGFSTSTARGARVTTAGVVLDDPALVIADRHRGPEHVSVTASAGEFLVTWMPDHNFGFRLTDVYGRRVSSQGTFPGGPGIPIATSFAHQWGPRVGFGDGSFLVAWSESLGRCGTCVWGQMLDATSSSAVGRSTPPPTEEVSETGERHLAGSSDGWQTEPSSPTGSALNDVWGLASGEVYAVGEQPDLFHYDGAGWSAVASLPNARKYGMWADGSPTVYAIGWCSDLVRYDGVSVDQSNCQSPAIGQATWPIASDTVLTVGVLGSSISFTNLAGWKVATGVPFDLWDLWAAPGGDVHAVGERGTVLRWDSAAWIDVSPGPTVQSLNALWGSAPNDLYAVGDFGTILHFDGAVWTPHSSGTSEHLLGVWGFGSGRLYAVGTGGTVLRYDGHGWAPESSGTNLPLMAVSLAGERMWAVGDSGVIISKTVPFFSDGFEGGDRSAWSSTIP